MRKYMYQKESRHYMSRDDDRQSLDVLWWYLIRSKRKRRWSHKCIESSTIESSSSIIKRLLSLQSFSYAHECTRNPPNCYSLPLECRHFSVEVTDSGSPSSVVDLSKCADLRDLMQK